MWEYYDKKTVFLTGGTGFLGTAVLLRLLSDAKCKRIYLLLRGGQSRGRQKWGESLPTATVGWLLQHHRLTVLNGDISEPDFALTHDQLNLLRDEVNIMIHAASSINLTQTLPKACKQIVQPSEAVARFGLQCYNLSRFVYVSTAYANSHLHMLSSEEDVTVEERIYPLSNEASRPVSEEYKELQALGTTSEYAVNDFPWAYGYAKHLSERLIMAMFTEAERYDQLLIVRPSIIGPAEYFPFTGYNVLTSSPITVVAAALANVPAVELQFASTMHDPANHATIDEVPVDVVVDRLLVHLAHGTTGCVHAVSGKVGRISMKELYDAIVALRKLPWAPRVAWLYESWHYEGQHWISKLFKVFGTSFSFSEHRTVALRDSSPKEALQGFVLFKTADAGPYELYSRHRDVQECAFVISRRMNVLLRVFSWIVWSC
ncbi:uncharacterized protein AKAW2_80537A [Aspergillus luchuensis]|uniref:Fatty acyl-CoA reductase n=1 Tax=Aspergillus kawachii TaxID=1069201 RepID=A0A7R7X7M0_ASPKA|nr:uncharacterized protein AKAW2_80537A [Aspergillus luchuensis]BCS04736.1 hypothetical protein AKAW2_80537A [Aspergillus luchuensis]BCS16306.1 hypothetical protein ALUC_80513A [Aspergillus luchuensis]GAA83704.1 male sterility domain containing protein [Aspergillus luchuensis IFO 4308]